MKSAVPKPQRRCYSTATLVGWCSLVVKNNFQTHDRFEWQTRSARWCWREVLLTQLPTSLWSWNDCCCTFDWRYLHDVWFNTPWWTQSAFWHQREKRWCLVSGSNAIYVRIFVFFAEEELALGTSWTNLRQKSSACLESLTQLKASWEVNWCHFLFNDIMFELCCLNKLKAVDLFSTLKWSKPTKIAETPIRTTSKTWVWADKAFLLWRKVQKQMFSRHLKSNANPGECERDELHCWTVHQFVCPCEHNIFLISSTNLFCEGPWQLKFCLSYTFANGRKSWESIIWILDCLL